ncbi:MAG: putative membrane protein SpoIIM required for sporulation [Candidatus Woesearchaeota archaeon]|jgi:uncharacterized membrane protein SpoIIM required for sporulation
MAIEQLFNTKAFVKKPARGFYAGFICATIGILLSYRIFPAAASYVAIALTIVPLIPLFLSLINQEEHLAEYHMHKHIWSHPFLKIYICTFIGLVAAFLLWYLILPTHMQSMIYGPQEAIIAATGGTLQITATELFTLLFSHNFELLLIITVMSFLFGAGAIFILTWNASVLAVFLANSAFTNNVNIINIWFHGIPEFLAYMIAALAGGVFGVVLVKKDFRSKLFKKAAIESLKLFVLSVLLLALATILEVRVLL